MFHAKANNLDDLMRSVFRRLLSKNPDNFKVNSRKGASTEIFGALLQLTDPRARIGRSMERARLCSPLGELTWYLSASEALPFISYYLRRYAKSSDNGETLSGAYGPRIFSADRIRGLSVDDQWQNALDTLRSRNGTRNSLVQIIREADIGSDSNDIPCTCNFQFVIRNKKIHMHTHMRSNDAFYGLPHDIFCFSMLQEVAARELGCELGSYFHSVASLHLYEDSDEGTPKTDAARYIAEDYLDVVPMPAMPTGDPWPEIRKFLSIEEQIRFGDVDAPTDQLGPYWRDLALLLKTFALGRAGATPDDLTELLGQFASPSVYRVYVLDRIERMTPTPPKEDLFSPR